LSGLYLKVYRYARGKGEEKVRNAGKAMDGVKRKIRATKSADPKKPRGLTEPVGSPLQLAREGDSPERSDNLVAPRGIQPIPSVIGHGAKKRLVRMGPKNLLFYFIF
jgi:hypothetical protein